MAEVEISFLVKKYKEKSIELDEKYPVLSLPRYPFSGSVDLDEVFARGTKEYGEKQEEKRKLREENPEVREFFNLRDLLVGKLYSLVDEVQNEIPLKGSCDLCPYDRFTIREK